MKAEHLPSWKNMPSVKGARQGFAWGLFDKDGVKDQLGTINLLTPEVVVRAREEIQTGKSVALNWGLNRLSQETFGRSVLKHELVNWREKPGFTFYSWDDEISINTQTGSQWDGLRHWGDTKTGLYYNGYHHDEVTKTDQLGVENWTKRGGIVGRGVLLDYASYAQRKGIKYSPMSDHAITVAELEDVARESGVTFLPGDILLLRVGWTKWYDEHSEEDREKYVTNAYAWSGIKGCEETLEWLWDHHFAAVASDNNGVEVVPMDADWRLHDFLLSGWGMPMGEMWDLEELSRECERQGRWTFFLTSAPLNLPGGAASPPNALAVF
ncbi:hypothetical protein ACRE_052300 [Hapsidospora chrysogenum ATCC 11550]|uniref:Cyclase-like protein n=1 Tax=Hapsidospora chrysogenum (strain ATCC 11550 / CBS 779.69 / DSM 880 / IAM 14645 / JCM 23072 / IMI 49137) TaxID=857340 RepID=A0A086T3P9_HAPC1|nr:hypothetical protein ACRE_052300 [Hapsidospora chrysogenum ATCC 11550]